MPCCRVPPTYGWTPAVHAKAEKNRQINHGQVFYYHILFYDITVGIYATQELN